MLHRLLLQKVAPEVCRRLMRRRKEHPTGATAPLRLAGIRANMAMPTQMESTLAARTKLQLARLMLHLAGDGVDLLIRPMGGAAAPLRLAGIQVNMAMPTQREAA